MTHRRTAPRMSASGSITVLVIDDEPTACAAYRHRLTELGYRVDAVTSGMEGLARFAAVGHAVVITDLAMPGWSGWEVVDRLRTIRRAVRVILITDHASSTDIERAAAERIELLEKPVSRQRLSKSVAAVVNRGNRRAGGRR